MQPLERSQIDGRVGAVRTFDATVAGVTSDLGGVENTTTVERALINSFAGCVVMVNDLNARLLLGQQLDLVQYSATVGALVRVASRLGVRRRGRDVSPTLADILNPITEPVEPAESREADDDDE